MLGGEGSSTLWMLWLKYCSALLVLLPLVSNQGKAASPQLSSIPSPSKLTIILILHLTKSNRNYLKLIHTETNKKRKQAVFVFILKVCLGILAKPTHLVNSTWTVRAQSLSHVSLRADPCQQTESKVKNHPSLNVFRIKVNFFNSKHKTLESPVKY